MHLFVHRAAAGPLMHASSTVAVCWVFTCMPRAHNVPFGNGFRVQPEQTGTTNNGDGARGYNSFQVQPKTVAWVVSVYMELAV